MLIDQRVKQKNWNPKLKEKEPYQRPSTSVRPPQTQQWQQQQSTSGYQQRWDRIGDKRKRLCWPWAIVTDLAPPLVPKHIDIDDGEIVLEIVLAWPRVLDVLLWHHSSSYFNSLLLSLFLYLMSLLCFESESRALSMCFSLNWKMRFSLWNWIALSYD